MTARANAKRAPSTAPSSAKGSAPDLLPESMQDYLAMLEGERQLSPHTLSNYTRELQLLALLSQQEGLGSDWPRIEERHVRRWLAKMHAQGLAPRSLSRRLSAWRTFFAYLSERGALKGNPVQSVRPPKIPKRLPKALSAEQAVLLVTPQAETETPAPPDLLRDEAIYELLYSSGLRLSELIDLDVNAVNARGYVDQGAGEVEVTGKGNKKRRVPMGASAFTALARWLAVRSTLAAADEPALFVSGRGTRISARTVQLRIKAHALKRNIPANVHPHVLRHSFASHVLQSSGDLRAVQEMLGHASIASTQVYTSLDFQRLASVYDSAHPRAKRKTK